MHVIPSIGAGGWTFDGNLDAPTFSPSVLHHAHGGVVDGPNEFKPQVQCHYFIRAGRIEFCGDSRHALAGKTVDLPPLPHELTDAAQERG